MSFCTAVNCMDGRVQRCVFDYLSERHDVPFVDMITEAGPNKVLAERTRSVLVESIVARIGVSVEKHGSTNLAVVAHEDCGGNPSPRDVQYEQTREAVQFLQGRFPTVHVVGLWADLQGGVVEID